MPFLEALNVEFPTIPATAAVYTGREAGAFEVSLGDKQLYSMLKTGSMPTVPAILKLVENALSEWSPAPK